MGGSFRFFFFCVCFCSIALESMVSCIAARELKETPLNYLRFSM